MGKKGDKILKEEIKRLTKIRNDLKTKCDVSDAEKKELNLIIQRLTEANVEPIIS